MVGMRLFLLMYVMVVAYSVSPLSQLLIHRVFGIKNDYYFCHPGALLMCMQTKM